jgi:hypothetical protein
MPRNQAAETRALERAATETGIYAYFYTRYYNPT